MSDEAGVRCSLQIKKGALVYQSQPTAFTADVTGQKGPTPGALTIPTGGEVVDLSELVQPGLYRIMNLEDGDGPYFEYGIYDPDTNRYYPWGECLPGETYIGRFSRNLQEEYSGTGTGTSAPTNRVVFKAHGGDCRVTLEAFEA